MPASVIAERVGWVRGMTVFNERVRELRPAYLPPDPAGRTTYDAGDVAQYDLWFPPTTSRSATARPAHRCSYRC